MHPERSNAAPTIASKAPGFPRLKGHKGLVAGIRGTAKAALGLSLLTGCPMMPNDWERWPSTLSDTDGGSNGTSESSDTEDTTTDDTTAGMTNETSSNMTSESDTDPETTDASTTAGEDNCPPEYCMEANTNYCQMNGDVPKCVCNDISDGDKCEICVKGYENQGTPDDVDCVPDITPPEDPTITKPNGGDDINVITNSVYFAGYPGKDTYKILYQRDGGPLEADPDYTIENNIWDTLIKDLPLDQAVEICVIGEDQNGNQTEPNEETCMNITHI